MNDKLFEETENGISILKWTRVDLSSLESGWKGSIWPINIAVGPFGGSTRDLIDLRYQKMYYCGNTSLGIPVNSSYNCGLSDLV